MKKIGNIICAGKVEVNDRFNVVDSLDQCLPDIPTLILGLKLTSTIYPDITPRTTDRELQPNIFWGFGKTESRREYEIDLELFIQHCYKLFKESVKYFFVDNIHLSEANLERTREKIKNAEGLTGYIHNDRMIYLYGDGFIFGIDLEISQFVGLDVEKIIIRFDKFTGGLLKKIPPQYQEDIERLGGKVRFFPYLVYSDNL